MFVVGNLFFALASLVHAVLMIAWWMLAARILTSWFRPTPPPGLVRNGLRTLYSLTDPVLQRVSDALPFLRTGGIDLSPIALFLGLNFLDSFIPRSLVQLGQALS